MLLDLQRRLAHAIIQGDAAAATSACEGAAERVHLGLRVYVNNAAHAFVSAAFDAFPKTAALVGKAEFTNLAVQYARTCTPAATVIGEALQDFPDFLQALDDLPPNAADCARFERLWLSCYHAADDTPLSAEQWAELSADEFIAARLVFHPSIRLYRPTPLAPTHTDEAYAFLAHPQALVRPALTVERVALTAPACVALEAMLTGENVGDALDRCGDSDVGLAALGRLIGIGAVVEFN